MLSALRKLIRGLWVGVVATWFFLEYGVRRLGVALRGGSDADVARLRGNVLRRMLADLGACFIKLGQIMSTRQDLFEPEFIDELRKLQDKLPAFGFAHIRRTVEVDLGASLKANFSEFDEVPVAAASVAQVHRARLTDGTEVAVKVLRPHIKADVVRDSVLLLLFGRLLNLSPTLRLSDPIGHVQEFVDAIIDQTDLRLEAANYRRFRANFAANPEVEFPEVHEELCSERVLTMQFIRGAKLDELGPGDHRETARVLREAGFKMCLEDGFVHADMHPGNMMLREDGVLVFLDVGLAKSLSDEVILQFVDMVKCLAMGNADDILAHIKRFHSYVGDVDWEALRDDLAGFALRYRSQQTADVEYGDLVGEVLALGRRYKVRPVTELAMVTVATVTTQGIGKALCPDVNDFNEMARFVLPLLVKRGEAIPDTDEARAAQAHLGL